MANWELVRLVEVPLRRDTRVFEALASPRMGWLAYLVALFVLPISVRLVLTWLYNASGRSIPIVGLYHASFGVATGSGFIPVLAPGVDPIVVYAGFAVLAVVTLVATRGKLGYRAVARVAPAPAGAVMAS